MIQIPTFKFAIREDLAGAASVNGNTFLPTKGTDKATGWDVRAALDPVTGNNSLASITLHAGQYAKIPLGFRVFAPDGWWLELRPRSSSFAKKNLHALYGVIDEDYEGQCVFACQYLPDADGMGSDLKIMFGEAIGQIIPVQRQNMVVEEASNEEYDLLCKTRNAQRGVGGFGSTGK